jgi:protein gp37
VPTAIEWCDETWNPIVGCSRTSPGCDGCYAIAVAARNLSPAHRGLTEKVDGRVDWTGDVRFLPERFDQPLRWRRPRRIFVNSMSDLFHPDVADETILAIFEVMARAPQHTFQVLTKRPQRMADFTRRLSWKGPENSTPYLDATGTPSEEPLPNVWLGTSIESQTYAWRSRYLGRTNAAVRWVSAEPLLGPLDLSPYLEDGDHHLNTDGQPEYVSRSIDWLVVGGESGSRARPMHPVWARYLRDQAADAGVPFLFKQWGEYDETLTKVGKHQSGRVLDGRTWDEYPELPQPERTPV